MSFEATPFEQWLKIREDNAAAVAAPPVNGMTPQLIAMRDRVKNMFRKKWGNTPDNDVNQRGKPLGRNDYNYDYAGDEDHIFGTDTQHLGVKPGSYDQTQELPRSQSTRGMRK